MKNKTLIITECAVLIAIGTVLAQIKLYRMPSGGSVTLVSMLPFIIIGFRHGNRWGLLSGLANALLQMALGGIYMPPAGTAAALIGSLLFDYLIAYIILGLSGGLAVKKAKNRLVYILSGSAAVMLIRFACSFISGFLIWGSLTESGIGAVTYSLTYNGSYMIPEIILTLIAEAALFKAYPKAFERQ